MANISSENVNLVINKVSREVYDYLKQNHLINETELYLVDEDLLDAGGKRVINVANPVELSDAANKFYVDNAISNIDLTEYYKKSETSSAIQISTEFENTKSQFPSPLNTNIQIIRPKHERNLNVKVGIYENQEMSSAIDIISSNISTEYFSGLLKTQDSQKWVTVSSDGFGREYSNLPVNFDLPLYFRNTGYDYKNKTKLYLKYSWFWLSGDQIHDSDSYSIILPSNTEVGANSQDSIGKDEFGSLRNSVFKDSYSVEKDENDYFYVYENKTNVFSQILSSDSIIVLDDYADFNTYRLKFTTSNEQRITLQFFMDLGNGPQFIIGKINDTKFKPNTEYFLEIKNKVIDVISENNNSQNKITDIQIIKPEFDRDLNLSLDFYYDSKMENRFGILDSRLSSKYFEYLNVNGNKSAWETPISAFTRDANNLPVLIKITDYFKDINYFDNGQKVYISYNWYWLSANNYHIADTYSIVVPSNTEVGANSQDCIGKKTFNNLYNQIIPDDKSIEYTYDYQGSFRVYSDSYNILNQRIAEDDIIILDNYNPHKRYRMTLSSDLTEDIGLTFYSGLPDGSAVLNEKLSGDFKFEKNKKYYMEIYDEMIHVYSNENAYAEASGGGAKVTLKIWDDED